MGCKGIKYQVVSELRAKHPVTLLCQLLKVSRSGYYDWIKRQQIKDRDDVVVDLIRGCQIKVKYSYGYRRLKIWLLKNTGLIINHKALLRIMRKYGLHARIRRKRKSHYGRIHNKFENIVARDFKTVTPNQKWVTDITLISTKEGTLYLSALQDLYDSSILGYQCHRSPTAKFVTDTIKMALKTKSHRIKTIVHSDQGTQYTSGEYAECCHLNELIPSMSRRGTPLDNACIENFFSALKCEWLYNANRLTIAEVIDEIDEYMHFFNNERITLKNGLTPCEIRNNYSPNIYV